MTSSRNLLHLDPRVVRRARKLAEKAAAPVVELARTHSTVSVERAVLRLAGLSGADAEGIPWVNRLVDALAAGVGVEHGRAPPVWHALRAGDHADLLALAQKAATGSVHFALPSGRERQRAATAARRAVGGGIAAIDRNRRTRARLLRRLGDPPKPWIYLIVATRDIHEDIPQAQAAAREGADVIAVIRSTGQSLLDYVPEGATREGFAGTYATQENFRLMRAALDDVSL